MIIKEEKMNRPFPGSIFQDAISLGDTIHKDLPDFYPDEIDLETFMMAAEWDSLVSPANTRYIKSSIKQGRLLISYSFFDCKRKEHIFIDFWNGKKLTQYSSVFSISPELRIE